MFGTTLLGWTVSWLWIITIFAIWFIIAFWPARVAASKGHSFWGYFIFSLFFFPLALLFAYLAPNRLGSATSPAAAPVATKTEE